VEGLLYVLTLMLRDQVMGALPRVGPDRTVLYLPAPCPLPIAPHDFSRSAELIRLGHALAGRFLARLLLDGPGVYGHPHVHERWPDAGAPGGTVRGAAAGGG
jgi:NTE family protein